MAGEEKHVSENGQMLDLGQLQEQFNQLLSCAHPDHLAAFFYWLDLRVAQFKVFGSCHLPSGVTIGRRLNSTSKQDGNETPASAEEVPVSQSLSAVYNEQNLDMTVGTSDDVTAKRMVKSLLRAMLVKPQSCDGLMVVDGSCKSEQDSSTSDDILERSAVVADVNHDDDGLSANGSSIREETTAVELETSRQTHVEQSAWSIASSNGVEKTSRCPYCLKTFRYRSSYRRHVKIHEGVFSHECTVCMRKFTRKEHFVRHKCDRRPNKPYNITHDVYRHLLAGDNDKSTAKHTSRSLPSRVRWNVSQSLCESPLELTTRTIAVDDDMSLLNDQSGNSSSFLLAGGSLSAVTSHASLSSYVSLAACENSSNVDLTNTTSHHRSFEIVHNESRRKSSTPRKVVATESDLIVDSDGCRFHLSDKFCRYASAAVSVMD